MSNTYTGTGGASGLEVRTFDLATDLFGIDIIEVSNGTLAVGSSPNIARITIGGGGGGGVTDIGFGTTGLTPAALTSGAVTVAGTLVAANGGTSFNTYAQGDIIYASAVNTLAKLTAGADGEVLTLAAGVPSWAASTGGIGGTIAVNQVAFGTGADTIGGSANLTYDTTTFEITGASGGTADFLRVTITGAAVSTPFVVDEIGHVGIGAANPNATSALTLNGDGTTYEGIMFQNGGVDAFKLMQDGAAFWNDSQINGYDYKIRLRDTAGTQIFSVFSANNTGEIRQGINTGTNAADVDAPLHVVKPTALTNAAAYPVRITHETSGTPAVGLGVGLEFESEGPAQAGVNYVGSIIESVSAAGTTAGNTRYDMVFKNYNGAAASEVMKITGTGALTTTSSIAAGTTVSAGTTVTCGTGVIATRGGVLASAGGVTATLGNIVADAGDIDATAGSVSAGTSVSATTTVTGGAGVIATTVGVSALGTGQITTANGPISAGGAFGTIVGQSGVIATTGGVTAVAGGVTATAGGVTATVGDITAVAGNIGATAGNVTADFPARDGTAGNFVATAGYSSQIAGQRLNTAIGAGADLADPALSVYGAVQELSGDTYTLGPYASGTQAVAGATATFLCTSFPVTCAVDGGIVTAVTGGGATGTGFTCPLNESFTIYCINPTSFFVFGNVTVV